VKLGNWSKKEINMLESNMAEYLKVILKFSCNGYSSKINKYRIQV
jgi:hypothetical protein